MKIEGRILTILPVVSGNSKFGTWQRKDIIVEQKNKYRSKLCLCIWDKALQGNSFVIGVEAEFEVEMESKLYNGSWFTQLVVKSFEVKIKLPVHRRIIEDDESDDFEFTSSEYRDMYEDAFENDPQWEWNID